LDLNEEKNHRKFFNENGIKEIDSSKIDEKYSKEIKF
jgi:hypothetical protein